MINTTNEEYISPEMKSPLLSKLENFWYYYKWHSIIALFLIFCITICSLQFCTKRTYDVHVLYAGSANIMRTSEDGDIPAFNRLETALTARAEDYNEDGEVNLSLYTLAFLSDSDRAEIAKDPELTINEALLQQDYEFFRDNFLYGNGGNYNVAFISPYVYEEYNHFSGVSMFMPVAPYLDADYADYELYSDTAVKLSSTAFYKNSATIREIFPEDTLVILKIKSYTASGFDKAGTDARYTASESFFRSLLRG